MKRLSFFVLWISALLQLTRGASSENKTSLITSQPCSMNVALNEEAVFNCGEMIFTDNGFEFTNELANDNSNRTSMLTVTASLENNNTNITCVVAVVSTSTFSISEPALLLIQGLLESVGDIGMFLVNSTTVLISWSPPFTLEGVPILGYNVTIADTTSGEDETLFVGETTLLYSINGSNPDTNFTIIVVPINVVGAGQPAHQVFSLSTLPVGPPVRPSATAATSSKTSIPVVTTVPSSTANSTETASSSGVSAGEIVGVVIGTLSFILVLVVIVQVVVVVVLLWVTQRSKAKQVPSATNSTFHQSHSISIELEEEVTHQENETGSQKTGTCTDDIEINPKPGNSYTTPASHCGCKVTGKYHVLAAPTTKSVLIRCSSSGSVDTQKVGSIQNAYIFVPEEYSSQVCLLDDTDEAVPSAKRTPYNILGIMTMSSKGLAGSDPSECPNRSLEESLLAQPASLESKREFCASLCLATPSHK